MTTTIPLGELVSIRGGGTPSRGKKEFWGGPIPWATVKDFKTTSLDSTLESITEDGVRKSATNIVPAGSIVVPTRMAVGKAAINTIDVAINQDLKALLPKGEIDTRFLLHFLLSKSDFLEGQAQGATVKGIKLDLLKSLPFPDLTLNEQRRIAAILDKADAIRRKREQALDLADEFLKSVFMEIFGDPHHNPKDWPVMLMDELGDVQGGLQVTHRREVHTLKRPYLRVANVYREKLALSEIKQIGLTESEFKRVRLEAGDVLIVEGHGNPDEIGRAAVWDDSIEGCVHQNHLIRFRPNHSLILPEFISRMLNSEGGRLQLIAAGRTTSGLNTISTKKVKEVAVPVPPLELQKHFLSIVDGTFKMVGKLDGQLCQSDDLFNSISQRAFSGEL